jgi:hypothetical protein
MLPVTSLCSVRWYDDLQMIWKVFERKWSLFNLRTIPKFTPWLEKTMKKFTQDIRCPDRDLNGPFSEYRSGALPLDQWLVWEAAQGSNGYPNSRSRLEPDSRVDEQRTREVTTWTRCLKSLYAGTHVEISPDYSASWRFLKRLYHL